MIQNLNSNPFISSKFCYLTRTLPSSQNVSPPFTSQSRIYKLNMAYESTLFIAFPPTLPPIRPHSSSPLQKLSPFSQKTPIFKRCLHRNPRRFSEMAYKVSSVQDALGGAMGLIQSSPPNWQSAILSNVVIFILGSPILVTGLSFSGICAAFLLGTLTWRAFGSSGFLLVATYFIIGTAATKVKMAQKEAQGVAEKRKGRRGPGSVIGSSAAGCVCAFLSIYGVGGDAFSRVWQLGFVASFCTKLNDTVSSEIGKAYGKTTYLVTTFRVVPRGTEGAVSVEGTLAGILASVILAFVGCLAGEVNTHEAVICILASQIANLGESIIGASLQDKEGFQWLNNDAVNIINISMGSVIAVLIQQALQNWHL